jgi:hypothetical protein
LGLRGGIDDLAEQEGLAQVCRSSVGRLRSRPGDTCHDADDGDYFAEARCP